MGDFQRQRPHGPPDKPKLSLAEEWEVKIVRVRRVGYFGFLCLISYVCLDHVVQTLIAEVHKLTGHDHYFFEEFFSGGHRVAGLNCFEHRIVNYDFRKLKERISSFRHVDFPIVSFFKER